MKKRILSLLLVLLMVVGMLPMQSFADDAENVCPICNAPGCTTHCYICGNDPCTCETGNEPDAEEPTDSVNKDYSSSIGKLATVNQSDDIMIHVLESAPTEGWSDSTMYFYPNEFPEGFVLKVDAYTVFTEYEITYDEATLEETGRREILSLWYQVSISEGTAPEQFPTSCWILQNYLTAEDAYGTDALTLFDAAADSCCGCENCTGAEGCECQCGSCDFCEKKEDPTDPPTEPPTDPSAEPELKEDTFVAGEDSGYAVSGNLPVGGKVTVDTEVDGADAFLAAAGVTNGTIVDITLKDSNGNPWQPAKGQTVKVTLPVADAAAEYVDVFHFLEDADKIKELLDSAPENVQVVDVPEGMQTVLANAIKGYQDATGTTDVKVLMEVFAKVPVGEGKVAVNSNGFSYYIISNGVYQEIQGVSFNDQTVVYVPAGVATTLTFTGDYVEESSANAQIHYVKSDGTAGDVRADVHIDYTRTWESITKRYGTITITTPALQAGDKFVASYYGTTGWNDDGYESVRFEVVNPGKVTFDPYGGTLTVGDNQYTHYNPYVVAQFTGTTDVPANPTRVNHTFAGWYSQPHGAGTRLTATSVTVLPTDQIFYAHWTSNQPQYTLTFDPQEGTIASGVANTVTFKTGDVINLIPESQITKEVNGVKYYFCGWYTEPEGGDRVGYNPYAMVEGLSQNPVQYGYYWKNTYIIPNESNTTLYAHWTTRYMLSKPLVGIGMNVYFYADGGLYRYGSDPKNPDGTTDSSYALPNEPSKLTNAFPRATNKDGKWAISNNTLDFLRGTAADYINANYMYNDHYFETSDTSDGSEGVAHYNGAAVKRALYLTEADYTDIFNVWYDWVRKTTTYKIGDSSYEDNNLEAIIHQGENGAGSTTIPPLNDAGNELLTMTKDEYADKFKIVPYVVKRNTEITDGLWYIDMIVMPRNMHVLGYERGNLADGYVWNPSTLLEPFRFYQERTADGDDWPDATVADAPNGAPYKVENGVRTEAKFKYWVDESGTIYNPGETVNMNRDYVLYAVWDYPGDFRYGSLQLTKNVETVTGSAPAPADQEFTFTLQLTYPADYNGSEPTNGHLYHIYKADGSEASSGNIKDGGTFKLQDDWHIEIDNLPVTYDGITPKPTRYRITETVPEYYRMDPATGFVTGEITAGNTTTLTVTNYYNHIPTYVITYNSNYPNATDPTDPQQTNAKTYNVNYTIADSTLGDYPDFAVDGYKFVKWNTAANGTGTDYAPGAVYSENSDLTLYAQWTPLYKYKLEFVANTGDTVSNMPTNQGTTDWVEPDSMTYTWTEEPTRARYKFKGWSTNPDATSGSMDKTYTLQGEPAKLKSVTLYAIWELAVADLTISKTVSGGSQSDTFIFHVKGKAGDPNTSHINMDVVITGTNSVVIHDLPVGNYTVTEDTSWSWRYTASADSQNVNLTGNQTVSFTNTYSNDNWLNDTHVKANTFND